MRNKLGIPRGERYEMCRSVHSEQNAIIAAPRDQMIGAEMYMCCTDPESGEIVGGVGNCMMCKRVILNAGIARVVVRDNATEYRVIDTAEWIENDDSLSGQFGY